MLLHFIMNTKILLCHFLILILIQEVYSLEGEVVEKWILQYQDHSDYGNENTWWMRYYENTGFFRKTGPMFVIIGGENAINPVHVESGFICDMAAMHGAILYYIEHRYYGESHPVPDTTFENLKYLRIDQALSDIEFFIKKKKGELEIPDIPVIVFGASYSGNLAAWMRVKYPQLVHGAVAVSAPVYIENDFSEFFDAVADSLRKYDENCATRIKEAFSELDELLNSGALNSVELQNNFTLCDEPNLTQPSDVTLLVSSFAQFIGDAVVHNSVESNGKTSIANLCIRMMDNEVHESPYHRLARIISRNYVEGAPCLDLNYDKVASHHSETSWDTPFADGRMWNYQTCTEIGCTQTFSSNSIFGLRVSMQYYMKICEDIFGKDYSPDVLNDNIKRINSLYNARLSSTTNIIFINGDLDPWHLLSVLHDLNDDSPAILIPGISHCEFLRQRRLNDPPNFIGARCRVAGILYLLLEKLD